MASKWKWISTEPRNDGTGNDALDIIAVDTNDNEIPGKHTTVELAGAAILAIANNAALSTSQKAAAVKALIAAKLPPEWLVNALDATVAANAVAVAADAKMDQLASLFGGYPVVFAL